VRPARDLGDGVLSIGGADFDKTMTDQLGDLLPGSRKPVLPC